MEATMNIPNLRTRGTTYWWRHRVPEHLKPAFRNNGHNPNQELNYSLQTKDLATALARQKIAEAWMQSGGMGKLDFIKPREHYLNQKQIWESLENVTRPHMIGNPFTDNPDDDRGHPTETIDEGKPPLLDDNVMDKLSQGEMTEAQLTAEQYAALVIQQGHTMPEQYKYSLRDALADHRVRKEGEIKEKTLKAFEKSVEIYLDSKPDIAIDSIISEDVANWIDSLDGRLGYSSRKNHVNRLAQITKLAMSRGRCERRFNPFSEHDLGKDDRQSIEMMEDSELLNILANLSSDGDRAWAIIARHSGMRQAEVAYAELIVVDDVECFNVTEIAEEDFTPKTDASKRIVPIRKSILSLVKQYQPSLTNAKDFSKRFGNVKRALYPDRPRVLCFHSLRKTFVTEAQRAGYHTEQVAHVVGHAENKGHAMTGGVYMKGHHIDLLAEIVEAVKPLEGY
jgi:integrase